MSRSELFGEVASVLRKYAGAQPAAGLMEQTNILLDMEVNSARLVDVVLDLEEKFGISISDDAMDKLSTVGDVVDLVGSLSGKSAAMACGDCSAVPDAGETTSVRDATA